MTYYHDFPLTYVNQSLLALKELQKSNIVGKYYIKALYKDDKIIKERSRWSKRNAKIPI